MLTYASPWLAVLYAVGLASGVGALALGVARRPSLPLTAVAVVVTGLVCGTAIRGLHQNIAATALVLPAPPRPTKLPALHARPDGIDPEISIDAVTAGSATASASGDVDAKSSDVVHIAGWAYDAADHTPCYMVAVTFEKRTIALAYGIARDDVAKAYGDGHRDSGFSGTFAARDLGPGTHRGQVRCVLESGRSYAAARSLRVTVRP